jgi:hypothetical protein
MKLQGELNYAPAQNGTSDVPLNYQSELFLEDFVTDIL